MCRARPAPLRTRVRVLRVRSGCVLSRACACVHVRAYVRAYVRVRACAHGECDEASRLQLLGEGHVNQRRDLNPLERIHG